METKKINRLILGIFLFHIAVVVFLQLMSGRIIMGVILSLSLGEIILLLPAMVYLLFYKLSGKKVQAGHIKEEITTSEEVSIGTKGAVSEPLEKKMSLKERLGYNKIKWSTVAFVLLFTWLSMPVTTLVNAISMLFVENTVTSIAGIILDVPLPVMLFLMAVMPACIEELIFRGIAYGGYRRIGTKFAAVMLSALMFGLMHMNLNQATYAFLLGILLALLFEATGSLLAPMLFHFIYNAQSTFTMFLVDLVKPGIYQDTAAMATKPAELYTVIAVYVIIAAVTTPLAFCVLYKIAKNEGRKADLMECLPFKQKEKKSLITVSCILAVLVAVGYIVLEIVLGIMLK